MRAVFWLIVALIAALLALFAVSNREIVSLGLWPLPFLIDLPVYLLVLAALILGFLVGELAAWLAARHWRREVRRGTRRIAALERELAATQAHLMPPQPAAPARR